MKSHVAISLLLSLLTPVALGQPSPSRNQADPCQKKQGSTDECAQKPKAKAPPSKPSQPRQPPRPPKPSLIKDELPEYQENHF